MFKKSTSILKAIASASLAALMCINIAAPAFADEGDGGTGGSGAGAGNAPAYGTEEAPAEATIAKLLKMPIGTTTPDSTFSFKFSKVSYNDHDGSEDTAIMPDLGDKVTHILSVDLPYMYAGTDKDGNPASLEWAEVNAEGSLRTAIGETKNIVDGIKFPKSGKYTYQLVEVPDTFTIPESRPLDKMEYSKAVYNVNVFVTDGENGPFVYYINAIALIDDDGNEIEGGEKVDTTPGKPGGDHSKLAFTNTYTKNQGKKDPDPVDPTDPTDPSNPNNYTVWYVSKEVPDVLGDKNMYFEFDVKIKNPATIVDKDPIKTLYWAYVMEDGKVVTSSANVKNDNPQIDTDKNGLKHLTLKAGESYKVYLKHGQKLAFTDMPVGSSYMVTESGNKDYAPDYTTSINGEQSTHGKVDKGQSLGLDTDKVYYLTEKTDDGVAFINTFDGTITETGFNIKIVPYITLIAGAMLLLAGYIAINRRKAADNA